MLDITKNDITLGCTMSDKADVLQTICQTFQAKGYTSGDCVAKLRHREADVSTYLGNGIALPHLTDPQGHTVIHSGVHLFQFPEGIVWDDDLHIAFLVVAVAAKDHEHLTILKNLAALLSNELVTRALSLVSHQEDFLKILHSQ